MQENQQAPEKQVKIQGPVETAPLSVHSVFHTIQGEGPFAGRPCVFIRLAGCNLQCNFCDTDYTDGRRVATVNEILCDVINSIPEGYPECPKLVVITGGEPFRQPIGDLIRTLNDNDVHVQIETNGTLYQPGVSYTWSVREAVRRGYKVTQEQWAHSLEIDNPLLTIVCSPKAGGVARKLYPHIDAYKYVVEAGCIDAEDGLPTLALRHPCKPRVARPHAGFASIQPASTTYL